MQPLHLSLSADPPRSARLLLAVLDGLAGCQPGILAELLLASPPSRTPLDRLRALAVRSPRRVRLRESEIAIRRACAWSRSERAGRRRTGALNPSLAMARALLDLAENQATLGECEIAFDFALAAEEVVRRARRWGRAQVADQRDIDLRAYALCGQLFRSSGRRAALAVVVRELEAVPLQISVSLRTQVRVLRLHAASARDLGQSERAAGLLFDAVDLLEGPRRVFEVDLYFELSAALTEMGSPREAAILLAALERRGRLLLPADLRARVAVRAAEAALAAGRPNAAGRALERAAQLLESGDSLGVGLELWSARAELWARTGKLAVARAGWCQVHQRAQRGSALGLRAVLAGLEIAIAERDFGYAISSLSVWRADTERIAADLPRRGVLFRIAEAIENAGLNLETLADARAYLRAAEDSPGLAFRRPWPGAQVLLVRD